MNTMTVAEYQAWLLRGKKARKQGVRPFANAKPTTVLDIKFPSKAQARVYVALRDAVAGRGFLFHEVRFPLLNLAPSERHKASWFTIDFVVVWDATTARTYVDAKSGSKRNREWSRGKRAFEAEHSCRVIEWDGVGSIPASIFPNGVAHVDVPTSPSLLPEARGG